MSNTGGSFSIKAVDQVCKANCKRINITHVVIGEDKTKMVVL